MPDTAIHPPQQRRSRESFDRVLELSNPNPEVAIDVAYCVLEGFEVIEVPRARARANA